MTKIYADWVARHRRRRLPDRHRQARQHGVLAAVRPAASTLRRRAAGKPTSSCSARSTRADPAITSTYVRQGGLPATLDFAFQEAARRTPPAAARAQALADRLRRRRPVHRPATPTPTSCPPSSATTTWAASARSSQRGDRGADAELLRRDQLAHELMFLTRGQPVVYSGDEQGFTGAGGDKDARQDMFASQVADYLDDDLIGTDRTHASDNYDTAHPLYRAIAELAALRKAHPALRDGVQIDPVRRRRPGVFAFSRIDPDERHRVRRRRQQRRPPRRPSPCDTGSAGAAFTQHLRRRGHGRPAGADGEADPDRAARCRRWCYRAGTPDRAGGRADRHDHRAGRGRAGGHPGRGHRRGRPATRWPRSPSRPRSAAAGGRLLGTRRPRRRTRVHHDLTGLAGGTPRRVQGGRPRRPGPHRDAPAPPPPWRPRPQAAPRE